jgi:N-acetylmuramoyl-L-alanine amidase
MSVPPPNRQPNDDEQPHEPPASVVFMEMMRRAASGQDQPEVSEPETPPPAIEHDTPTPPKTPMTEAERQHLASLEAERLRRVQRRKHERDRKRAGMLGGVISSWFIVIVAGALIATILSWGTSPNSLSTDLRSEIGRITNPQSAGLIAEVTTPVPTPNYAIRIGIVSGHMGPQNDPGAVCPDGLTEAEINYAVAERLLYQLAARGYEVDLLEETDRRLADYRATFLISIHANDCRAYTGGASGFLIAKADHRASDGEDTRLVECVGNAYEQMTGLTRRYGLTRDMEDYHVFNRIHPTTPGAIIELGFLRDDREFLVNNQDLMADAIMAGVDCFLRYENPFANETPTELPTNTMIDAMIEDDTEDEQ